MATVSKKIPKRMTAALLTGIGGPEKLVLRHDVPVPSRILQSQPDHVLLEVKAAGVNNTDINTRVGWYSKSVNGDTDDAAANTVNATNNEDDGTWRREGMKFPRIQGADVCGIIVAVGENVSKDRIGERVLVDPCPRQPDSEVGVSYFGSECDGGFAQYTVCAAKDAHVVTCSNLKDTELASFPCSYSTANNLLTRAKCSTSDVVLVTGASGGVGSAIVQLAKHCYGATKVIAICNISKAKQVQALGADVVLDRNTNVLESLGPDSVTLVVDLVGGPTWPSLLDVLARYGRYATSGAIAGPIVELDLRTLYLKDLNLLGCTALDEGVFAHLMELINTGKVRPVVAETYPLSEIGRAQEDFRKKNHVGKIVLIPPPVEY